jgi:hypothetical protein
MSVSSAWATSVSAGGRSIPPRISHGMSRLFSRNWIPQYAATTASAFSGPSTKPMAMAGMALRSGPTVGTNSSSPAMKPSANAAFTFSSSMATVVTPPITAMAMSCVTSHFRSTVAISVSTSPALFRARCGKRCIIPSWYSFGSAPM